MPQPAALFADLDMPVEPGGAATPVMAQYLEIKAANPDCLLFYRMGDFYEMFFDDAVEASRAIGLTLTKRGKHHGADIPMAGVPVVTADDTLQKLIAAGFRVAVAEQLEDPATARKRGAKAVVRRDVVRLVTPGTLTEDALLVGAESNFLASLARRGAGETAPYGLAWADLSTGLFNVRSCDGTRLASELMRLAPREILLDDALYNDPDLRAVLQSSRAALTPLGARADSQDPGARISRFFHLPSPAPLQGLTPVECAAAAMICHYVERTQRGAKTTLSFPTPEAQNGTLVIDPAARLNLELTRTLAGEKTGSLLHAIDRTLTAAGRRLLADYLAAPLATPAAISARLEAVSQLVIQTGAREALRALLRESADMARALARLAVQRAGPRDLGSLRDGLAAARRMAEALQSHGLTQDPFFMVQAQRLSAPPAALLADLKRALAEDLPPFRREGRFVAEGYAPELDAQRNYRDRAQQHMMALQSDYAMASGVKTLKIKHNNVLGYFIEVNAQGGEKLRSPPHNATFFHRQSLANVARFGTAELADIQAKIFGAADEAQRLEDEIFNHLSAQILAQESAIKEAAQALAVLDATSALAARAVEGSWVKPLVDDSLRFHIEGGRHPVVEAALRANGSTAFIANDCNLSASGDGADQGGRIVLLTGPNMAGKSTYLRQNALIAVLAQMGSFVPAKAAHIGVVDRLYSRVGAADDLARGRSTFMVEMVETAAILNQATARSLVILDEIGRGTATFDGLAIAWASVEHLHNSTRCRALFATHFHELTALEGALARLVNQTLKVKTWSSDIVFLYEIGTGVAPGSYGLQVARLAGVPHSVLARAKEVMTRLDREGRSSPPPLHPAPDTAPHPVLTALEQIDPDRLTARDALDQLYALKQLTASSS